VGFKGGFLACVRFDWLWWHSFFFVLIVVCASLPLAAMLQLQLTGSPFRMRQSNGFLADDASVCLVAVVGAIHVFESKLPSLASLKYALPPTVPTAHLMFYSPASPAFPVFCNMMAIVSNSV
jgi:hypothetical protein